MEMLSLSAQETLPAIHVACQSQLTDLQRSLLQMARGRIAVVRCIALHRVPGDDDVYEEASSVSVKVHCQSMFASLLDTVAAQTQRHVAVWQDAAMWSRTDGIWQQLKRVDNRCHLLEVFSMARRFCESGVCPSQELHHASVNLCGDTHTLTLTVVSDGSPRTLLEHASAVAGVSSKRQTQKNFDCVTPSVYPASLIDVAQFSHKRRKGIPFIESAGSGIMARLPASDHGATKGRLVHHMQHVKSELGHCHSAVRGYGALQAVPLLEQGSNTPDTPSNHDGPANMSRQASDPVNARGQDRCAAWVQDCPSPPRRHEPLQQRQRPTDSCGGIQQQRQSNCHQEPSQHTVPGTAPWQQLMQHPHNPELQPAAAKRLTLDPILATTCASPAALGKYEPVCHLNADVPLQSAAGPSTTSGHARASQQPATVHGSGCHTNTGTPDAGILRNLSMAIESAHRYMCPYILPSTVLRLLALGPTVISVGDVFSQALPFSPAVPATYHQYIHRIRSNVSLPLAAAAAALDDLEKSCTYATAAREMFCTAAASHLADYSGKQLSHKDAKEVVARLWGDACDTPPTNCSATATSARVRCDFLAMAASGAWRDRVAHLSAFALPYNEQAITSEQLLCLTDIARLAMDPEDSPAHQGLIKMTACWLRRLNSMLNIHVREFDYNSLTITLQNDNPPATSPSQSRRSGASLTITLALSLEELLDGTPQLVGALGQYAAAHAQHVVPSRHCTSSDTQMEFRLTEQLQQALRDSCARFLAATKQLWPPDVSQCAAAVGSPRYVQQTHDAPNTAHSTPAPVPRPAICCPPSASTRPGLGSAEKFPPAAAPAAAATDRTAASCPGGGRGGPRAGSSCAARVRLQNCMPASGGAVKPPAQQVPRQHGLCDMP
eukprot:jgi/Ulvmu1/11/UM001_0011.1